MPSDGLWRRHAVSSGKRLGPSAWHGVFFLFVTALGWALNWPAMKILLREWPPLFSRGIAGVVASAILIVIASLSGERIRVPRRLLPRVMAAACTNVLAWMGLSTLSMQWLSVGEGALLVYTMPIWSMLLAWPLLGRKPSGMTFFSMALGILGLVVLVAGRGIAFDAGKLTGIACALGAAVLFALGAVGLRTPLAMPPIALVAWQVGLGSLPMVAAGLSLEHPNLASLRPDGLMVLIYMTLVPMGVCYLTWFATLRHLAPDTAATGMLLVPIIGIVAAAFTLGEVPGVAEIVAMFLTLSGVALALQYGR